MICVILNPNARGVARDRGLAMRLRRLLGADGEVKETRTPDELASALEGFAASGCDLIASCGGDGTNLSTFSESVRRFGAAGLPRFALLRGGTVNTVAENLGVRGRPEEILARILDGRRAGRWPIEQGQDLLRVNGMHGFLFAAAMGARFLEAYYGGPVSGVAWASTLAARVIASALVQGRFARWLFDPIPVELIADGERVPIDAVRLLLAATIPSVGIGMKVTWRGGEQPNRFHLIASAMPMARMALQLARVLGGRPLDGAPHVDRLVQSLQVRFDAAQTFTLDGELFRDREITLEMGPRIWIVKG